MRRVEASSSNAIHAQDLQLEMRYQFVGRTTDEVLVEIYRETVLPLRRHANENLLIHRAWCREGPSSGLSLDQKGVDVLGNRDTRASLDLMFQTGSLCD